MQLLRASGSTYNRPTSVASLVIAAAAIAASSQIFALAQPVPQTPSLAMAGTTDNVVTSAGAIVSAPSLLAVDDGNPALLTASGGFGLLPQQQQPTPAAAAATCSLVYTPKGMRFDPQLPCAQQQALSELVLQYSQTHEATRGALFDNACYRAHCAAPNNKVIGAACLACRRTCVNGNRPSVTPWVLPDFFRGQCSIDPCLSDDAQAELHQFLYDLQTWSVWDQQAGVSKDFPYTEEFYLAVERGCYGPDGDNCVIGAACLAARVMAQDAYN